MAEGEVVVVGPSPGRRHGEGCLPIHLPHLMELAGRAASDGGKGGEGGGEGGGGGGSKEDVTAVAVAVDALFSSPGVCVWALCVCGGGRVCVWGGALCGGGGRVCRAAVSSVAGQVAGCVESGGNACGTAYSLVAVAGRLAVACSVEGYASACPASSSWLGSQSHPFVSPTLPPPLCPPLSHPHVPLPCPPPLCPLWPPPPRHPP